MLNEGRGIYINTINSVLGNKKIDTTFLANAIGTPAKNTDTIETLGMIIIQGKASIANALMEKGISVPPDPSFETLKDTIKLNSINSKEVKTLTGIKSATGSVSVNCDFDIVFAKIDVKIGTSFATIYRFLDYINQVESNWAQSNEEWKALIKQGLILNTNSFTYNFNVVGRCSIEYELYGF